MNWLVRVSRGDVYMLDIHEYYDYAIVNFWGQSLGLGSLWSVKGR
jgi:hypothetical protein